MSNRCGQLQFSVSSLSCVSTVSADDEYGCDDADDCYCWLTRGEDCSLQAPIDPCCFRSMSGANLCKRRRRACSRCQDNGVHQRRRSCLRRRKRSNHQLCYSTRGPKCPPASRKKHRSVNRKCRLTSRKKNRPRCSPRKKNKIKPCNKKCRPISCKSRPIPNRKRSYCRPKQPSLSNMIVSILYARTCRRPVTIRRLVRCVANTYGLEACEIRSPVTQFVNNAIANRIIVQTLDLASGICAHQERGARSVRSLPEMRLGLSRSSYDISNSNCARRIGVKRPHNLQLQSAYQACSIKKPLQGQTVNLWIQFSPSGIRTSPRKRHSS